MKGITSTDLDGSGLKVAIISTRWNTIVCERLEEGAKSTLLNCGVEASDIEMFHVPGAFELPLGAKSAANTGRFDAIVCLGAVIRGETPHFDFVAGEAARGIMDVGLKSGIPATFGVITADDERQALARAGGEVGNKGSEAAEAAVEMALLQKNLRTGSADSVGFRL